MMSPTTTPHASPISAIPATATVRGLAYAAGIQGRRNCGLICRMPMISPRSNPSVPASASARRARPPIPIAAGAAGASTACLWAVIVNKLILVPVPDQLILQPDETTVFPCRQFNCLTQFDARPVPDDRQEVCLVKHRGAIAKMIEVQCFPKVASQFISRLRATGGPVARTDRTGCG